MAALDYGPDIQAAPITRRACLVAGCGCRDARVLSRRRAAFFASLARAAGETADRMIEVEDDWRLPPAAVDQHVPQASGQPMTVTALLLLTTELVLNVEGNDR